MIYDYQCNVCQAITNDVFRKMVDRDEPNKCSECGSTDSKLVITKSPSLTDSWSLGRKKPDQDFNYMMNRIKNRSKGSNMNIRG